MGTFTSVIIAALLIEAVVNLIQNINEKETSWKYWASLIAGMLVSVLVTYNWNIDIFAVAGFGEGQLPLVGVVLTGLIISRGANVISDLVGLINNGATTIINNGGATK